MTRLLLLTALACSGPPEVADPPPHCEPDGWLRAVAPCVEACTTNPEFWKFGYCHAPEEQRECVILYRGMTVHVVRRSDVASATEEDLGVRECR
jgi:hypothetical protein